MNLVKRIVVAAIFIPGVLGVFWLGGWPLTAFLAAVSLLGMWELRDLFKHKGVVIPSFLIPVNALFFLAATLYDWREVFLIFFAVFAVTLGRDIILDHRDKALLRVAGGMFSLVYSGLFLSSIHHIRALEGGRWLILLLLVSIWITDSMAYFVGMRFGRHRGVVKISPKKSVEGFIAGFVFAFTLPLLAAWLRPDWVDWTQAAFIGVAAGVFGQVGDLFESMLKRDAGVKDSSRLLPGHGGILDRFDSLFVAAPFLYLVLLYWG